jgi:hypothetical protein
MYMFNLNLLPGLMLALQLCNDRRLEVWKISKEVFGDSDLGTEESATLYLGTNFEDKQQGKSCSSSDG